MNRLILSSFRRGQRSLLQMEEQAIVVPDVTASSSMAASPESEILPSTPSEPPTLLNPADVGCTAVASESPPDFATVKSPILKHWLSNQHPPPLKRESVEDPTTTSASSSLTTMSEPLSVDIEVTTSQRSQRVMSSSSNSANNCAVCDPRSRHYKEYPGEKKNTRDIPLEDVEGAMWVSCDGCHRWFHQECVGIEEFEAVLLETFHCLMCTVMLGPSRAKKTLVPHRRHEDDEGEANKPEEIASRSFCERFARTEASRFDAPPAELVAVLEDGLEFESVFKRDEVWKKIFHVKNKRGLGIRMPEPGELTIDKICELAGESMVVQTIDVYRQQSVQMKMKSFVKLFKCQERQRLYNMLSLEFSDTPLEERVQPPTIVRELSWVGQLWSKRACTNVSEEERVDPCHINSRPEVEMYCLLGMAGSFTDFHVDFGGSSVWYHIYKGQKIFYVIEPTRANIDMYHKWQMSTKKGVLFFADLVNKCYRVVIKEGETLLIPSGWIHAVLTPVDSIVFGGNFLHSLNITTQLRVYEKEYIEKLDQQFLFPSFEMVNWYQARILADSLLEGNDDGLEHPAHIIEGVVKMVESMNLWISRNAQVAQEASRPYIFGDSMTAILAKLSKELANYERIHGLRRSPAVVAERMIYVEETSAERTQESGDEREEEKEEGKEKKKGPKIRLGLQVPASSHSEPLRGPTANGVEEVGGAIPPLKIRRNDLEQKVHSPKIVVHSGAEADDEINMVKMFGSRSSSGRKHKPASWLKDRLGDDLERELQQSDEREAATGGARRPRSFLADPDYDAKLEEAERRERGEGPEKKRKKSSNGREGSKGASSGGSAATSPVPRPAKKPQPTAQQRLTQKMKQLKKK